MSLIDKLDNGMMYFAEKAARAYNWTTGRGKADLANTLEIAGNMVFVGSMAIFGDLVLGAVAAPLAVMWSIHDIVRNKELEEKERSAAEEGCRDLEVELNKSMRKMFGPLNIGTGVMFGGIAGVMASEGYVRPALFESGITFTFLNRGMADYVMRTEYLPPRKNCISRGVKWVKEKVSSVRLPSPSPEPAVCSSPEYALPIDYRNLEMYVR